MSSTLFITLDLQDLCPKNALVYMFGSLRTEAHCIIDCPKGY